MQGAIVLADEKRLRFYNLMKRLYVRATKRYLASSGTCKNF
jgi:hypothetical protein